MAHTTISPPSRTWSPAALTPSTAALRRLLRSLRPPWMLAALVVVGTTVGILAMEVAEVDLARERDAQLATSTVLNESAQSAASANALSRIRISDLRAALAAQADELASTEGLLK